MENKHKQGIKKAPGVAKSKALHRIGWAMRLVGVIGLTGAILYVIPSGPFAFFSFFAIWYWTLPTLLLLIIGHHLASRYKEMPAHGRRERQLLDGDMLKKWKIFFIALAIGNLLTVILPVSALLWLERQAKAGVSGTEFGILMLVPIFFIGIVILLINVISVSMFLNKHRPEKTGTTVGLTVATVSFILFALSGILIADNSLSFLYQF